MTVNASSELNAGTFVVVAEAVVVVVAGTFVVVAEAVVVVVAGDVVAGSASSPLHATSIRAAETSTMNERFIVNSPLSLSLTHTHLGGRPYTSHQNGAGAGAAPHITGILFALPGRFAKIR